MHPNSCEPSLPEPSLDSANLVDGDDNSSEANSTPVESAGVGSVVRFLLVPLSLVAAMVAAGLLLGWLVSPNADPKELIEDLGQDKRGNWRKALVLANLLRDPEYAEIRRDPDIATQLASLLRAEIEAAQMGDERVKLRVFLCRALGEFETSEVLPELIRAGSTERDPAEIDVRRSAIEALAIVVSQLGPEQARGDEALMSMALDAAVQFGDDRQEADRRARLRGSAAFLLGVLGGDRALQQLVQLLEDPTTDVRCNAATALARHGRVEAIDVLQQMLDPDNADVVRDEPTPEGRDWKRALIMTNAIAAVTRLAETNPTADFGAIIVRLERLAGSRAPRSVQIQAEETLQALKSLQAE